MEIAKSTGEGDITLVVVENGERNEKDLRKVYEAYRDLGGLFEASIGKAQVVVCSIALEDGNPVARQFRHSLLQYMAGDKFAPKQSLKLDELQKLFAHRRPPE